MLDAIRKCIPCLGVRDSATRGPENSRKNLSDLFKSAMSFLGSLPGKGCRFIAKCLEKDPSVTRAAYTTGAISREPTPSKTPVTPPSFQPTMFGGTPPDAHRPIAQRPELMGPPLPKTYVKLPNSLHQDLVAEKLSAKDFDEARQILNKFKDAQHKDYGKDVTVSIDGMSQKAVRAVKNVLKANGYNIEQVDQSLKISQSPELKKAAQFCSLMKKGNHDIVWISESALDKAKIITLMEKILKNEGYTVSRGDVTAAAFGLDLSNNTKQIRHEVPIQAVSGDRSLSLKVAHIENKSI